MRLVAVGTCRKNLFFLSFMIKRAPITILADRELFANSTLKLVCLLQQLSIVKTVPRVGRKEGKTTAAAAEKSLSSVQILYHISPPKLQHKNHLFTAH
jgi:hypothetical protein